MSNTDNLVLAYLQGRLTAAEKELSTIQLLIEEQKRLIKGSEASKKNNAFLKIVSTPSPEKNQ